MMSTKQQTTEKVNIAIIGSNFIVDTFLKAAVNVNTFNFYAIYSRQQQTGEEKAQQFLDLQKDKYLEGKRREGGVEPTLALVDNQDYIYYAKGAINMFALQEAIGEDQVNLALNNFIEDWNTLDGKLKTKTNNYATSKELLGYFRDVTPEHLQYIITELFESVVDSKINQDTILKN